MLTRPALSEAATLMPMLLPVHTLPVGDVMLTVGGVVSPPPPPPPVVLLTVTVIAAVAVRPAPSVTVRFSVWAPLVRPVVFQVVVAVDAEALPLKMVAPLSTLSTNAIGVPCALLALMPTATLAPLTVAPLAGLVIDAPRGGGGVVPPPPVLADAPEGTSGELASLKSVTGADSVWLPAVSRATAWT